MFGGGGGESLKVKGHFEVILKLAGELTGGHLGHFKVMAIIL